MQDHTFTIDTCAFSRAATTNQTTKKSFERVVKDFLTYKWSIVIGGTEFKSEIRKIGESGLRVISEFEKVGQKIVTNSGDDRQIDRLAAKLKSIAQSAAGCNDSHLLALTICYPLQAMITADNPLRDLLKSRYVFKPYRATPPKVSCLRNGRFSSFRQKFLAMGKP